MNSIVRRKNLVERFDFWTSTKINADRFLLFRRIFVAIWILYDATDLLFHGAIRSAWTVMDLQIIQYYVALQIILLCSETAIFLNYYPRFFAFVCLVCRGIVSYWWTLNDFLFYCLLMAILTQCKVEPQELSNKTAMPAHQFTVNKWPVDIIILQTSWVYFATAVLKISPLWLSGGSLYVRIQDAKRQLGFAYPSVVDGILTDLSWLSPLAKLAVVGELLISYLLLYCFLNRRSQNLVLRYILCGLTVCIHGFAALTSNVFFFGAVMITTVCVLNLPESESKSRHRPL